MSIITLLHSVGISQGRRTSHERRDGTNTPFSLPTYNRIPSGGSGPDSQQSTRAHNSLDLSTKKDVDVEEGDLLDGHRLDHHHPDDDNHISRDDRSKKEETEKSSTYQFALRPFLSSFTIGFADGLTVPFALTAGLSWLGSSHMVITAGSAEICAGCISMGIGGYLAGKGEENAAAREEESRVRAQTTTQTMTAATTSTAERRRRGTFGSGASSSLARSEVGNPGWPGTDKKEDVEDITDQQSDERRQQLAQYLAPLNLPPDLSGAVFQHCAVACTTNTIPAQLNPVTPAQTSTSTTTSTTTNWDSSGSSNSHDHGTEPESTAPPGMSPIMTGLSVSVGYLLGGLLPLFPYFFVKEVKHGLVWSFLVCVVVLFLFGAFKEFVICVEQVPIPTPSAASGTSRPKDHREEEDEEDEEEEEELYGYGDEHLDWSFDKMNKKQSRLREWIWRARRASRKDVKESLREGLIMAGLGSVAAVAAVLCVMLSQVVGGGGGVTGESEASSS